jgi:predicted RNA binding protein YcfA (HicA-like mRNA interferase family)
VQAFKACRGEFSFREFERMLEDLGFEEKKHGKTSGSARKYHCAATGRLIMLHKPHGDQMGAGMVRRLRRELEDRGII